MYSLNLWIIEINNNLLHHVERMTSECFIANQRGTNQRPPSTSWPKEAILPHNPWTVKKIENNSENKYCIRIKIKLKL